MFKENWLGAGVTALGASAGAGGVTTGGGVTSVGAVGVGGVGGTGGGVVWVRSVGEVVAGVTVAVVFAFRAAFFLRRFFFLSAISWLGLDWANVAVSDLDVVVIESAAWAPVTNSKVAHSPLAVIVSQLRYWVRVLMVMGLDYEMIIIINILAILQSSLGTLKSYTNLG